MFDVSAARCGHLNRRNFLQAGTLAVGGFTLADLFRLPTWTSISGMRSRC
jgi:hypothetical protein